MTIMAYFSEREGIRSSQSKSIIEERVWRGIQALISARILDASFGRSYPYYCQDGEGITGCDQDLLNVAILAEIPKLPERPWEISENTSFTSFESSGMGNSSSIPETPFILDLIEFCWRKVSKPLARSYHSFYSHDHYEFDIDLGREEFQDDINRIFDANNLAYLLEDSGQIIRKIDPVWHEGLQSLKYQTHDGELNRLLTTAVQKFSSRDMVQQSESLEALWDAWERLKTLGDGSDKKEIISNLLDTTAGNNSPKFRAVLELEAKEITKIGNQHRIRHSELSQEPLGKSEHRDYLFYRLLSLIHLILKSNG